MVSASLAEVIACIIRVPVELAKQRRQAATGTKGAVHILVSEYRRNGLFNGIYKGFGTTILREIPFSFIQFPLWEFFKLNWQDFTGTELNSGGVAVCGALAGGISAAITTPLDVVKTRVMLSEDSLKVQPGALKIAKHIYAEKGLRG